MRAVAPLPASHAAAHGVSPALSPRQQAPESDFAIMLDALADQTQAPDVTEQTPVAGAASVPAKSSSARRAAADTPAQGADGPDATASTSEAVNLQAKVGPEASGQSGLSEEVGKAADQKPAQDANALILSGPLVPAPNTVPAPATTAAQPLLLNAGKKSADSNATGDEAETKSDSKKQQDVTDVAAASLGPPPAVSGLQQPAPMAPVVGLPSAFASNPASGDVAQPKATPADAITAMAPAQAAGIAVPMAAVAQAAGAADAEPADMEQSSLAAGQTPILSKAGAPTSKSASKSNAPLSAGTSQKADLPIAQPDEVQPQIGDSQPPLASAAAVPNSAPPAGNGKPASDTSGERKLADIVAMHRSSSDPVSRNSDTPKDLFMPLQWSAAAGPAAASSHADPTAASVVAANSPGANTLQQGPVPLAGVPVLIAGRALAGDHHFDIRLDPPDLGRIEVRLKVDKQGQVSSHLIADRPETLALLRRDGGGLERALQDAGLKTTGDGLQFSLRDQSGNGQGNTQADRRSVPVQASVDNDISARELMPRNYVQLSARIGGVDIRI